MMKTQLSTLVATLALSPFALADTLKVPTDFETIQDAIDAASAGDTVSISSGDYTENLVIPVGLDGLTLRGKGTVWINAQTSGDGVTVASSDVTISRLGIRHANGVGVRTGSPGDGELVTSGLILERLVIINSDSEGILANADGCEVANCVLIGNGNGLTISGDGARVTKTLVKHDCDNGIDVTGDDVVIDRCTVTMIEDGNGIVVDGDRPRVTKNSVTGTDGTGIDVSSKESAVVENNRIDTTDGDGLVVSASPATVIGNSLFAICGDAIAVDGGSGHRVEKNRVSGVNGVGLEVDGDGSVIARNVITSTCETGIDADGDGLEIVSNRITNVGEDEDGLFVTGTFDAMLGFNASHGSTIEKNKVVNVTEYGFELRIVDSIVSRNTLNDCGSEDEGAITLRGNGNTIEKNTLKGGDGTGLDIDGSLNLAVKNRISEFTDNGILIDGDMNVDNVLEGNSVSNNFGDGIENAGIDTLLRGNKVKGNLQDISNEIGANYVDDGGNSFATGGLTVEPVID